MTDGGLSREERIKRVRRLAEEARRESDRHRTAEMEAAFTAASSAGPGGLPFPGTCHPYYSGRREMIEAWLAGTLGWGQRDRLTLPRVPRFKFEDFCEPVAQVSLKVDELDLRKFRAPAPYVGEPYELWWSAGIDRLGRAVAGEIRYEFLFPRRVHE